MSKLKTLKFNMVTFRQSPLKYKLNESGEWITEKLPIPFPFNRSGALAELQLADVNLDNYREASQTQRRYTEVIDCVLS